MLIVLLQDIDILPEFCTSRVEGLTEYQLLVRCASDQTIKEESSRRIRTKEAGMDSIILQSPADPDATCPEKPGKSRWSYVANVRESVGGNGSSVTDCQFETNKPSSSAMLKERLNSMESLPGFLRGTGKHARNVLLTAGCRDKKGRTGTAFE